MTSCLCFPVGMGTNQAQKPSHTSACSKSDLITSGISLLLNVQSGWMMKNVHRLFPRLFAISASLLVRHLFIHSLIVWFVFLIISCEYSLYILISIPSSYTFYKDFLTLHIFSFFLTVSFMEPIILTLVPLSYSCFISWIILLVLYLKTHHHIQNNLCFHLWYLLGLSFAFYTSVCDLKHLRTLCQLISVVWHLCLDFLHGGAQLFPYHLWRDNLYSASLSRPAAHV